jgi:cytochrome P450
MPVSTALGRMVTPYMQVYGYRLPAGTFAVIAIRAIHRGAAIWHDSLTFDGDRFGPQRSEGRERWQYLPFVEARGRVSAITSPCLMPSWRWLPFCGVSKSALSTLNPR